MNVAVRHCDPDPIEIDPRPCGLCGLTIARHVMVDTGDGPEHFCPDILIDDLTLDELERRAELRREEEVAAILARMDAAYPYVPPPVAAAAPAPHRTPQATVDAFNYLVRLKDAGRLRAWLAARPDDAPFLLSLLEGS